MHNGVKVVAGGYHGKWMMRVIHELRGHHEPQEEKVFYEVLKHVRPDALMVEVGSFWAYYSLWFRQGYANRKNYLIEPDPKKLALGQKNFVLNGFTGDFTHGYIPTQELRQEILKEWESRKSKIQPIYLDQFAQEKGIEFIDILHADIQGAELSLLKGARRLISKGRIGYVFLSTHSDRHEPCLEFLHKHTFEVIAEHSVKESASADGLIVAQSAHVPKVEPIFISKLD
jgi:FkbM family methyltransferase